MERAEAAASGFLSRMGRSIIGHGSSNLLTVAQSLASSARTTAKLGVLADNHEFFEFDPQSAAHGVRAVVFNFNDGYHQLELLLDAIDGGAGQPLWVNSVSNYSTTRFAPPSQKTRNMLDALIAASPTLSQSKVFDDFDYRFLGPGLAAHTLLVFVTVGDATVDFGEIASSSALAASAAATCCAGTRPARAPGRSLASRRS